MNKLEWYVLRNNFNTGKIESFNVLNNWEDRLKKIRKKTKNKEEFKEQVKREFMYYYWCKTEYEILVSGLFAKSIDDFQKIDIWTQLEPNLNNIINYIINKMNFKFYGRN